jgi:hypothetical protein
MKINITGAPGVGVDAGALKAQEERLLGFTKETSDFVKKIQTMLSQPPVIFTVITIVFVLSIEIFWGSYFKTSGSASFAANTSEFIRAMTYFSFISGTILMFGFAMYFVGPMIFGEKFDDTDRQYIMIATAVMIAVYFFNCFVTGVRGEGTYTILGNFLTIK